MSRHDRLQALYSHLPVSLQAVMFAAEGARVHRFRYGGDYERIYGAAQARLEWSPDRYHDYAMQRLQDHLTHVVRTVPRYRAMATPSSIRQITSAEGLRKHFPLATKADLKEGQRNYESRHIGRTTEAATGGTTGDPLRFATTRRAVQEQWAIWWRYRALHGITPQEWSGHFGGQTVVPTSQDQPPFWRTNVASRLTYFSPHHLTRRTASDYMGEINRRQLRWLHGYPTVLKALAHHVIDLSLELHRPVRWITTGAEGLSEDDRSLLEAAFGATVRQHYGMAEAAANLSECGRGTLHVDEDHAVIEFLPFGSEGQAKIVGTALSNPATAFVRYDTGDIARLADTPCACGLPGAAVQSIQGRTSDFVELPSGALVGPVNQVAKGLQGVKHLQLRADDGESLTAVVTPRGELTIEDREQIVGRILERSALPIRVSIEIVERPVRTSSGKAPAVLHQHRRES